MADIVCSNVSYSGLVEKYIGTAYDNVKIVADNIDAVLNVGDIDGIEDLAKYAKEIKEDADRAELAALSALNSASEAAASAAQAADSVVVIGDSEQVCLDAAVVAAADAVKTAADVITTDANRQQTQIDAAATAADRVQTSADRTQTQLDVITTGQAVVAANIAKDDAELALRTFVGQYLGASATTPVVDGNGDPLTEGDLYQDTSVVPNLMKFYNGTTWLVAYSTTDVIAHSALSGLGSDDHSQYLLTDGSRVLTGPQTFADGGIGAPSINFDTARTTGFYKAAAVTIGFAASGAKVGHWDVSGLTVLGDITVSGIVDGVDVSNLKITVDNKENDLGNPATGGDCLVSATNGTRAWETRVKPSEMNTLLALKENSLGLPDIDGKVISSTAAGARSWVKNYNKFTELGIWFRGYNRFRNNFSIKSCWPNTSIKSY